MIPERSHRLIIEKRLNFIFAITSEVMLTIFGNYDHLMIVYLFMCFMTSGHFIWLPWLKAKKKYFFKMTAPSKPLKMYDSNFSLNLVKLLLGKGQFKI